MIQITLTSRARYTRPNLPFPRGFPISKSLRDHCFLGIFGGCFGGFRDLDAISASDFGEKHCKFQFGIFGGNLGILKFETAWAGENESGRKVRSKFNFGLR